LEREWGLDVDLAGFVTDEWRDGMFEKWQTEMFRKWRAGLKAAFGILVLPESPDTLATQPLMQTGCIQAKHPGYNRRGQLVADTDGSSHLRDSAGKIVKDPVTGKGRRVDFVVQVQNGKWKPVEVTSRTANKRYQISKKERIRNAGGICVRNKKTLANYIEI